MSLTIQLALQVAYRSSINIEWRERIILFMKIISKKKELIQVISHNYVNLISPILIGTLIMVLNDPNFFLEIIT